MTEAVNPGHTGEAPSVQTAEAVVRRQMSSALGGRRGMIETAIPGILFTVLWLTTKNLQLALVASVVAAGIALVARLVQRSTVQYGVNALVGIGIGWVFVRWAASSGGTAQEQALAYFLPGILYSLVWVTLMAISCLATWPFIGFMVGSVTGDPTAWHADKQIVKLCTRLTWLFITPSGVGVLLQGPVWLLGWTGTIDIDLAVVILGILRVGLGWPLRIGAWGAMVWLLARDATPVDGASAEGASMDSTRPDPA